MSDVVALEHRSDWYGDLVGGSVRYSRTAPDNLSQVCERSLAGDGVLALVGDYGTRSLMTGRSSSA